MMETREIFQMGEQFFLLEKRGGDFLNSIRGVAHEAIQGSGLVLFIRTY